MENAEPLTATQIASKLNRTPKGVIDAIRRLRIKPKLQLGRIRLYHANTVGAIARAMRKPNKGKGQK